VTSAVSRSRTTDRRFYGVAEALVAEIQDPEKECRVKLRLPWFDSSEVTGWCRIANLFAGNGYGSTWTPELEDEVLVAFIHGDLRFPIVLGGLYNGKDKPPRARTADTNQKTLRTKAGHEVLLDDSSKTLGVEVTTSAGHRLRLDDVKNQITLEISGGPSIVMSKDGSDMQIKATSITLDAKSITLKASGTLKATGSPIQLNPSS
jgi:phage baseplate assembly protein V